MTTVIVTGGRDFRDQDYIENVLTKIHAEHEITQLVEGGAKGVDYHAKQWALKNGIDVKTFPADWKTHKLAAGPIRNELMAQYASEAEKALCVAFFGGKGTASMKGLAKSYGITVIDVSDTSYLSSK